MGKHFAAVIDANIGFGETGALMMFKPAVHFYFSKGQTGFFIGPVVSYMKLKEKGNEDIYIDNIYGAGFSIGVKSSLSNRAGFNIMLSPQYAVGAGNAEGGTATLQVGFGYKL